jgi:hypothetical protein
MKNLIKKILMEGDFDWASEGTDEGDGNHFISAMGKLEWNFWFQWKMIWVRLKTR